MGDQDLFDEAYKDNNYIKLVITFDGTDFKLKLNTKKVPGVGQSGTIYAKRKRRKFIIDFGLGDEEFDESEVPNPMKRLIESGGGGPNGYAITLPPRNDVIRDDYTIRPYQEYASRRQSREALQRSGKDYREKDIEVPLTKAIYSRIAKWYLELLGVPLYI